MEKVFLIYNSNEIEINKFSIQKYISQFKAHKIECVLLNEKNFKHIKTKPFCVINRTDNYKVAQYFENLKIRVFNNSTVCKICNDKLKTYEYLGKEIKHLTIFQKNDGNLYPFILKDPKSKGGKDVFLINNENDFQNHYRPNMMMQQFLPNAVDIRTYVIGKEIVLSIKRIPIETFKANYKINHKAEIYHLTPKEKTMIQKIIEKFDFDYVGIDILKAKNGEFYFSEIEDSVGARAVYELTDIDIISQYVDYIVQQIKPLK